MAEKSLNAAQVAAAFQKVGRKTVDAAHGASPTGGRPSAARTRRTAFWTMALGSSRLPAQRPMKQGPVLGERKGAGRDIGLNLGVMHHGQHGHNALLVALAEDAEHSGPGSHCPIEAQRFGNPEAATVKEQQHGRYRAGRPRASSASSPTSCPRKPARRRFVERPGQLGGGRRGVRTAARGRGVAHQVPPGGVEVDGRSS